MTSPLGESNPCMAMHGLASALMPPLLPALMAGSQPTKVHQLHLTDAQPTYVGTLRPVEPAEPYAMPAAPTWCEECLEETIPVPLSDPEKGWILHPCHEQECGCCYEVGTLCDNCGKVDDCCECVLCTGCHDASDTVCDTCDQCSSCCDCYTCPDCGAKDKYGDETCGNCSRCTNCCTCYTRECDCGECHGSSSSMVPGWVRRNESVELDTRDIVSEFNANYAQHVNPATDMCDFYLTEYVSAVMPASVRYGRNNGLRSANLLLADALTFQGARVAILADAFLEYGFLAIGGEVRHHPSVRGVNPTHGRENTWTWWADMGQRFGYAPLLQDALELFRDRDVWGGGFGGEKWAVCTEIVLAYATHQIDAKTFVDRCFALQHNGGSFLDKVYWRGKGTFSVSHMRTIGDAHAAETIDFHTLLRGASSDVQDMLRTLVTSFPFLVPANATDYTDGDLPRIKRALPADEAAEPTSPDTEPIYSTTGTYCYTPDPTGGYVCTKALGHKGNHVAATGPKSPCAISPWPVA